MRSNMSAETECSNPRVNRKIIHGQQKTPYTVAALKKVNILRSLVVVSKHRHPPSHGRRRAGESRLHEQKLAQEGNREIRTKLSGSRKGTGGGIFLRSWWSGTPQAFKSVLLDGSDVAPAAAKRKRTGEEKPTRATRRR
jgi:hypothetical protein